MKNLLTGAAVSALAVGSIQIAHAQEGAAGAIETDVIVVTGFRSSLAAALDDKRNAIGVQDGIKSEDIGKFPDLNISEALQRITGITIDRDVTGEGNTISLRGLAPELTRVTLNGMTASTGAQGREFEFDVFASEVFSQATVSKTPSAKLSEGGLAGTIDLRTPAPLEVGNKMLLSAGGQFAELGTSKAKPRAFGLISRESNDGRFGFLASVSYSESIIRGDTSEGFRFEPLAVRTQLDDIVNDAIANGDPIPTVNIDGVDENDADTLLEIADRVNVALLPRSQLWLVDRERLGATGSFQFRPNDRAEFALDFLYSKQDEQQSRYTYGGSPGFSGRIVIPTALTIQDDYVIAGSFDPLKTQITDNDNRADTEFYHATLRGDVELSGLFSVAFRGGYSNAEENKVDRFYSYTYTGAFNYDLSNREYAAFDLPGFDIFDSSGYLPSLLFVTRTDIGDELYEFRADTERRFLSGSLQSLEAGVEYRNREKSREQYRANATNTPDFAEVAASDFPVSGFLKDAPAGVITEFPIFDFDRAQDAILPDSLADGAPERFNAFYTVKEAIVSGYVQSNWAFDLGGRPLDANLGVRVANTQQTSSGFLSAGGEISPLTVERNYTDVLPSVNIRYELQDDLIARVAANRAITRPTLSQLSVGTTASGASLNGTAGNPDLDPFRATQADLSLEWYFADEALLSATVFYKDVESFIVTAFEDRVVVGDGLVDGAGNDVSGSVFSIRTPINGVGGELYGVELQYQQPFTFLPAPFDGFGILANATIARSEGTLELGGETFQERLQNQSDFSANVVAYYEKGPFSARAAFSHRGDYVAQYRGVRSNGQIWSFIDEDRNQLDLAFRYDLFDGAQVYLDAINITDSGRFRYDTLPFLNAQNYIQGTVYNFGVRVEF